jgi:hypothetical protein
MKTANVYEIERALQQPITPQQRQTAAANNPVAALLAQRLDGVEGSLRTKMQTPPPPQGTVMNQYYQWPQQQPEMGLAQPGLEQMAQQYAAGGLVAFADGGPVYDVDGGDAYADGGLASMLPMGYAGEDDVPVFNGYAYGGNVLKSVFPATFDEDEYDAGEGDFGDVGSGAYGLSEEDVARDIRDNDIASRVAEEEAMKRYSAGPGDIIGTGVEGAKKVGSALMDMAFIKDPAWEAREKAKEADYYKTTAPPPSRSKPAEQGIAAVPTEEPGMLDRLRALLPQNTESGEDRKQKEAVAEKGAAKAAEVAAMEKPTTARKASVSVPSANPVRLASTSGIPGLEPIPAEEERKKVAAQAGREVEAEFSQPSTPAQAPEQRAIAQQIVESKLTADQQIAALAKYFQTDTSEAMRIKGEMEKESAHAGNVGIMAVLANALGMGLGTYGTGAARWGAGLMAGAQGMMSEEKAAAARQDEINKLRREIAESPNKQHNEAAKMYFDILREQGKLRSAEDIARAKAIQQQKMAEYNAANKESQFVRSESGKNARTAQMVGAREQAEMNEKMKTAQNLERYYRDSTDYRIASEEERIRRIAEIYAGQGLTPPGAVSSQGAGMRPIITRSGIQSPSAP